METVIRVTFIYFFIMFGLRVLGKREFGQLSPLELVTLLLIPEIVAQGLVREDFSMTNAIVGISTLFALVFVTSFLTQHNRKAEAWLTGTPTVLAFDGAFITENMNRERITPDEIYTELHKAGLVQLSQARWIILEPDGKLAVIANDGQDSSVNTRGDDDTPL